MHSPPDNSPVPSVSMSGLASLATFVGFAGFVTVGALTQLASVPFGLWWTEAFIFFGVPYVMLRLSGRAPLPTIGFTRPWVQGCAFGFGAGVANFFAVVAPIQFVAQRLAPKWLIDMYDAAKVFQDKGPIELAFIVGGVCIAAPLAEETFFRGLVQRGFSERMPPAAAIVITGAVFSAFHLDPVGFPARWELGVLFGLLAWRSGSLWPGIFAHLANNLTSSLLYFALKDEPKDPTDDPTALLAIAGVGGLLLLLVLLLGRRFPAALTSPQPARETVMPSARPSIIVRWAAVGLASIAVLLVSDPRGSAVRAIDMSVPVKNAGPELKQARERTLKGEDSLRDYWEVRRRAKPAGDE